MTHLCRGLAVCLCKRLRRLNIKWVKDRLADGYDGWYDHDTRTIYTDDRLTLARTRTVLAHEIVHAERGDRHTRTAWGELRQEHHVDVIAARMLLPIEHLADALIGATDEFTVAEVLQVDIETLRARLADMTQAETEYIDIRVQSQLPRQQSVS